MAKVTNLNKKPTRLTNLISEIPFFNRTNIEDFDINDVICNHWAYDLNSDKQELMYFDQPMAFIYPILLSFFHEDTIEVETDDEALMNLSKSVVVIRSKGEPKDSLSMEKSPRYKDTGTGWYRTGSNYEGKTLKEMSDFLGKAELSDEDNEKMESIVQNILWYAQHLTSDSMISRLKKLNDVIQNKKKTYQEKMDNIKDTYSEFTGPEDYSDSDRRHYEELSNKIKMIEKWRIWKNRPGMLLSFSLLIFHSFDHMAKDRFKIENWAEGVLDVLIDDFNSYYPTETLATMRSSDFARLRTLFDKCHKKDFRDKVAKYLQTKDKSLWTQPQKLTIFKDVWNWYSENLYFCPHAKVWVTITDNHGHHLHFRSSGEPQKTPENFFPLSTKYNMWIGDNSDRNIVAEGGNFIDAFDYMMKKIEDEMDKAQIQNQEHYQYYHMSLVNLRLAKSNCEKWLEKKLEKEKKVA